MVNEEKDTKEEVEAYGPLLHLSYVVRCRMRLNLIVSSPPATLLCSPNRLRLASNSTGLAMSRNSFPIAVTFALGIIVDFI